jgi:phage baseplate assembly protein V
MPFKTPELSSERFLEGMVRCGRVTKVKTSPSVAATVTSPDRGFQSGYLIALQRNTIGHQDYYVPVPGEAVWVLMQGKSLNRGLILGSAYTDGCPPPFNSTTVRGMKFADGSYIIYDTSGSGNYQLNLVGKVTATVGGSLTATVSGAVTLKAPTIKLDGNVEITGTLKVDGVTTLAAGGTAIPNLANSDGSGGGT